MRQAVHSQVVAPEVLPHCLLPRSLRRQAPPKKDVPKLQQAVLPLLLVPGLLQKGVPPVLSQAGAGTQKDVPDVRQAVLALPFVPSLLQQGMPPVLSQAGAGTRKDVPDVQQAVLTLTFLASLLQQGMPLVAERRSPQSRPGAGSPEKQVRPKSQPESEAVPVSNIPKGRYVYAWFKDGESCRSISAWGQATVHGNDTCATAGRHIASC